MRRLTLLLCAALLLGAPVHAQEVWVPPQKTIGEILPFALTCTTLADLRAIIGAAQRGGQYASNDAFKRINAASQHGAQRCGPVWIEALKTSRMHPVETYHLVETLVNSLQNIVVVETKVRGKKFFLAIERDAGPGNAI